MDSKFSVLDKYGENFSKREYITNPAIGRDEETQKRDLSVRVYRREVRDHQSKASADSC